MKYGPLTSVSTLKEVARRSLETMKKKKKERSLTEATCNKEKKLIFFNENIIYKELSEMFLIWPETRKIYECSNIHWKNNMKILEEKN